MKHLLLTTIAAVVLVGCGEASDEKLVEAAKKGSLEKVKAQLNAGINIDATNHWGWTALHGSASGGHIEIVKLLISNNADLDALTDAGQTPLHIAVTWANFSIVQLLIDGGAKINAQIPKTALTHSSKSGATPTDWAMKSGLSNIADLLRKHGGKTKKELEAERKSETLTNKVLRVSCGPRGNTYMPFTSWQVGGKEPIGYDPDLIKLIAKEIGVLVKFIDAQSLFNKWRETAVDPRLSVLSEDIADVSLYAITINNERKKLVDFSEPYFTDGLSILVKRESGILSLNELKGKKILAPSNTVAYPWTKKNLPQSIIVSEIRNFFPNDLILKGTVDAYIADRVNLLAISSKDNRLVVLPRRLTTDHLGIAIKKGNTELLGKINSALIKFKENGELKKLEAKWF